MNDIANKPNRVFNYKALAYEVCTEVRTILEEIILVLMLLLHVSKKEKSPLTCLNLYKFILKVVLTPSFCTLVNILLTYSTPVNT